MEYRKLGKWGLRVSSVSLGSWLTYGGTVDQKATSDQIKHAFERGINFFDTANVYANGAGETAVGKALKILRRSDYVLATKVFFPMGKGPNDKGLSRKHVIEQCMMSLQRMQVDYIDLYQCHRYDADTPVVELVHTMNDLIKQGKILYWGVSEWSSEQIEEAVEIALSINAMPPVSNQPQYNMLSRGIEEKVIPTSKRLGLGQVVFSPLAQGVLTGKYKPDAPYPKDSRAADDRSNGFLVGRSTMSKQTLERVQRLKPIADELGVTMAQLALAWCLRLPEVSSVITGATKLSQIDDNIKAAGLNLSSDVLEKIDEAIGMVVAR